MCLYREASYLELDPYKPANQMPTRELRHKENRVFKDNCRLHKSESSFHIDAARVWNAAPNTIKNARSLNIAKKTLTFSASHCQCKKSTSKSRQMAPLWCPSILKLVKLKNNSFRFYCN